MRVPSLLLAVGLLILATGTGVQSAGDQPFEETRFWTGCNPGPYQPPPAASQVSVALPASALPVRSYSLVVDLDSAVDHRPILGTGFNLENALWSCPSFRSVFKPDILDAFQPAVARVDSGLLPAAPSDLPAARLGPDVYSAVLSSAPYAESWEFMRSLNQAGVRIILGVWGGPAQFTFENDRLGTLDPSHYDDYVDYVSSVVSFLVRDQGIDIWATTIANEPDGGDGNAIAPSGLVYIAHRLAERLQPLGVKLYGPDTSRSDTAMDYLPGLLDDPTVAGNLAFVGLHEYTATGYVDQIADYVRAREPDLPVVVTEYTSFDYGDLDSGQPADDSVGFMLDIANTLLSHYRANADAALYWDAVDYLQPGHNALTRWGMLRGPQADFAPRRRYYGMLQILPYLRPGTRVLDARWLGDVPDVGYLALQTVTGAPAIVLVNQGLDASEVTLGFSGASATGVRGMDLWRSDADHYAAELDPVAFHGGSATLVLPPRSLTTLVAN
jgi:O-glycosyl hydrolase